MCRLSYEKCACFVFLVILAVLSCSGFRIDDIAMTDISRRNSHTSRSSPSPEPPHRLRHHRHLRPTPSGVATPLPAPPRAPRSSPKRGKRCPEFDASWKTYKADAVVVARVESKSSNCKENCTVQFRVLDWVKGRPPYDGRLRLSFRSDNSKCDYDEVISKSQFLVRTKIDQSKKYILFLNTYGPHNFSAAFVPEPHKKKTEQIVRKVTTSVFKLKPVRVERIERRDKSPNKRLRLVCKVRGFPIPIILWKRNNTLLHPNHRTWITQKKRRSTLVIRNFSHADSGRYECIAQGVDGSKSSQGKMISGPREKPVSQPTDKPISDPTDKPGKPCASNLSEDFCQNGGTCFAIEPVSNAVEYACLCPTGYTGSKCTEKTSDHSSMYRQTPIYTCKIGLYTKYDNC